MSNGGMKGTGLAPNLASVICYLFPPVTSVVMMLSEKANRDVQFHAWQGTVFGICVMVVYVGLKIVVILVSLIAGFLGAIVNLLFYPLGLLVMILLLTCWIKAYQGERWKIPYLGDYAEKKVGLF